MADEGPTPPAGLSPAEHQRLEDLRTALVRLHKTLLEAERIEYEGEHGRIRGNSEYLRLLLQDPRFGWLRPLTGLVVHIDQLLATDGLPTPDDLTFVVGQARRIVTPAENGDAFERRYHELLQQAPAVVMAHGQVVRALRSGEPG
jgi:hypothetical protein